MQFWGSHHRKGPTVALLLLSSFVLLLTLLFAPAPLRSGLDGILIGLGALTSGVWLVAQAVHGRLWYPERKESSVGIVSIFAALGLMILAAALESPSGIGDPVPPTGTVINANTGGVADHAGQRANPQAVELAGGHIVRACNLTRDPRCNVQQASTGLTVQHHDMLEILVRLKAIASDGFLGGNSPLPYVRLYVSTLNLGLGVVRVESHFRYRLDSKVAPPQAIGVAILTASKRALLGLAYVPGSTRLYNRNEMLAHLPDGIMEQGVELTEIGPPASCVVHCQKYVRYVGFRLRVD